MAMRTTFLLAASCVSLARSNSIVRDTAPDQQYINSVCSPNVTATAGATIPPCVSIKTIQQECAPNGTQPLDFVAHAECLCNAPSTFFSDWLGCRDCILIHGGMTQRDHDTYADILSAASSSLCTGTPTSKFEDIFATVESKATPVATGSTVFNDQFTSSTAVSLYYTASGVQGSGAITGSATGATASVATTAAAANTGSGNTGSGNSVSATTSAGSTTAGAASKSPTPTSSSKNGALPTLNVDLGGMVVAAGGAVLAMW